MKSKFSFLIYTLYFTLIILLVSCGNEAPVLSSIKQSVIVYQEGSLNIAKNSIFLSVYFILDDPNGIEDITEVKITNTESEYSWIIPKEIISKSEAVWDDKKFTGYSFLEYNNAESVLTGEYLIEATDSVGNIAEGTFFVEISGLSSNAPFALPQIKYQISKVKNNEYKISGDSYYSAELKLLSIPKAYKGGRKKTLHPKNIIIEKDYIQPRNLLSVRVNKNEEENFVFFLKNFTTD